MGTNILDVIEPSVFNPYVIQKTAELSALSRAGIISNNPELDALASSGGRLLNMPYWNDLVGNDEVLDDGSALTPDKITASQDVAVLLMRGKSWSVNDLAAKLSGADPMGAIGTLVAEYWARRRQAILFAMLRGVFLSPSMAGNVHDISGGVGDAAVISAETFVDALQKLGDAKYKITAVGMHSATVAALTKAKLITGEVDAITGETIQRFMNRKIIEDDGCPVSAGVYTTYLFGEGAIGLGNGGAKIPTETGRDILAGDDILVNRQHFILHPRGVKFNNVSIAKSSPDNLELAEAQQWSRVYENKNVRLIQFNHKIA